MFDSLELIFFCMEENLSIAWDARRGTRGRGATIKPRKKKKKKEGEEELFDPFPLKRRESSIFVRPGSTPCSVPRSIEDSVDGVRITVPSGSSHVVSRRVATHTCRRRRRRSIEPGPPSVDVYIHTYRRVACYVDACWLRYVRLDPRIHVRTHFAAARRAECQSAREPSCPIRNRTRERERETREGS